MNRWTGQRLLACIVLVVAIPGCAGKTQQVINLDAKMRSNLGEALAVGVRPVVPEPNIETPFMHYRSGPTIEQRLAGAGTQAADLFKTGGSIAGMPAGNCGRSCALVLALTLATDITGATVGLLAGAVSGSLAGEVGLGETVARLINEAEIPRRLQSNLVGTNGKENAPRLVPAPDDSLSPWAAEAQRLGQEGIASLIDIVITRFALVGTDNAGPHTLSISLKVSVKYIRKFTIYEKQYYSWQDIDVQKWDYESRPHTLAEWSSDNEGTLNKELDIFYGAMRDRLTKYVGLVTS